MAKDIDISLSCMGYGYEVKVLVNDKDIGIKGGKSESKRLFNSDHSMAKEATPEILSQLFVLKEGENKVHLEFKKTSNEPDSLTFELSLTEAIEPTFSFKSEEKAGSWDKTFVL